jgi:hypothetical protein
MKKKLIKANQGYSRPRKAKGQYEKGET